MFRVVIKLIYLLFTGICTLIYTIFILSLSDKLFVNPQFTLILPYLLLLCGIPIGIGTMLYQYKSIETLGKIHDVYHVKRYNERRSQRFFSTIIPKYMIVCNLMWIVSLTVVTLVFLDKLGLQNSYGPNYQRIASNKILSTAFWSGITIFAVIDFYSTTAYLKKHNFLESSELDEIGS